MKEILKTLMKYKWKMLLVIFLLLCSAYCNLALPEYTSNIVNVGIASNGIESIIPEAITKENYNKILRMVNDEDKNRVNRSYNCSNNVCTLKEVGSEQETNLESILLYPMFILSNKLENVELNIELVNKTKEEYKGNETFFQEIIINYLQKEYKSLGIDLNEKQMSYIYKTGKIMIFISIIGLIITVYSIYLTSKIAANFGRDLRNNLVNKVMSLESEEINTFSTASLLTRCTNDVMQVQNSIFILLRTIIFAPIMGIGASVKVANNPMGWVIILAVIVILTLMLILFLIVVPKFKKFQDLLDKINLVSRETLSGLQVIRAYTNEQHEEKRFESVNTDLTKNGLFVTRSMAIMSPTLTFIMNSVSILIVWVGSKYVNIGSIEVGDLIAFISYTMHIMTAFLMVSMVSIMLPRMVVSFKRISEIFKTNNKIKNKEKTTKLKNVLGEIEFKDVYFRYPNSNENVLRNINFKIKPGSITAFIGSTGSGKSTLINLIPRFFDVTSGKILIDNIDIKDIKIEELRNIIGYVPQKGWLSSGTIESNIAYGMKNKDKKTIENASILSESYDFINEKENKFDTEISSGGTNVSGGQRQRISIARAIAKNPNILIFDDSFSALDFKTEASIRKNINKKLKGKTILIVSSRISSVMHADNIIVLNDGEVVGIGTHNELLNSCEVYKEIKTSQLGGENYE